MLADQRRPPRWTGRVRGPVMDHHRGELVVPKLFIAEGKRIACIRSLRSGEMVMLELEAHFHENDLEYEEDVHVLSYRDARADGRLGNHEFTRSCPCNPEIMEQMHERTLVIHIDR